jgi:hypothetical protein
MPRLSTESILATVLKSGGIHTFPTTFGSQIVKNTLQQAVTSSKFGKRRRAGKFGKRNAKMVNEEPQIN